MKKILLFILFLLFFTVKGQTSWSNKEYFIKTEEKKGKQTEENSKKEKKQNEEESNINKVKNESKKIIKKEIFINPIRPRNWSRISSKYGTRKHPILKTIKHHTGIDIPAPTGTPVYAVLSGYIEVLSYDNVNGNYLKINHQNGYVTAYCHLSKINIKLGQWVEQGTIIAYVGSTGRATGPHLHYEVRYNGVRQNPENYLLFK